MELSKDIIKEAIDNLESPENEKRLSDDSDRFVMYQGQLKQITKKAIAREFENPETVEQLIGRIVPINIMQKIINKLAQIYRQAPIRRPMDMDEDDQELMDLLIPALKLNMNGKMANRFYKLHKHTVWEPFVDDLGVPRLRTLPSQTYTPMVFNAKDKSKPDLFIKHLFTGTADKKSQRFSVWTDESFAIIDGAGSIVLEEMQKLNNTELVNPFGRIPFVYISENDDGRLVPIPDDDLITMQIVISLILTDLAFASKYQLWSILAIENGDGKTNIQMNPNSIVNLPIGSTIKQIKPSTDIDMGLEYVEALVGMILTTKNLSVGDITGQMSASNAASGVAKMIDRSESTEDREDQEAVFIDAEKNLWDLIAHHMYPVWMDSNKLSPEYMGRFNDDFEASIIFKDPKPMLGDKELVEVQKFKIDNGFTTMKRALAEVHPELNDTQIDALILEIRKEKVENLKFFQDNIPAPQASDNLEEQDGDEIQN